MDQILNKVGTYWFSQKANKEMSSVGDDLNVSGMTSIIIGAILIVVGLYSVIWGKFEVALEKNACRKPLLAEDRASLQPCELP